MECVCVCMCGRMVCVCMCGHMVCVCVFWVEEEAEELHKSQDERWGWTRLETECQRLGHSLVGAHSLSCNYSEKIHTKGLRCSNASGPGSIQELPRASGLTTAQCD